MEFDEPARVQHVIDLLVQGELRDLVREPLDERHEAAHRRRGLGAERIGGQARRGRFPHRRARALRVLADDVDALRADAARRQVDHALERGVVHPAGDDAQVGERILDFRALEEPQAAVHAIRNARRDERFFEHARLGVRAIQDRDVPPHAAAVRPVADALDDEVRFVALVERGVQLDRLALGAAGPEVLAEAAGVVRDQRVGGIEDRRGRAIVLLEADQLRASGSRG